MTIKQKRCTSLISFHIIPPSSLDLIPSIIILLYSTIYVTDVFYTKKVDRTKVERKKSIIIIIEIIIKVKILIMTSE